MSNAWLEDITIENLIFLKYVSRIIHQSGVANLKNDRAGTEIQKEILEKGRLRHQEQNDRTASVDAWLKAKKREYRKRDRENGHSPRF